MLAVLLLRRQWAVYVVLICYLHPNAAKCLVTLTTSHWPFAQDRNIYLSLKAWFLGWFTGLIAAQSECGLWNKSLQI